MASRRAPPPRTRVNSVATSMQPPPPPIQRARSAMAKPLATKPEELRSSKSASQSEDNSSTETINIQVVIRCRGRSETEVAQKSPVIVNSAGPKSHQLDIETATPVSSLGVVGTAPQRTYPFDLVFGPEADQAMIYHEVVSPMLDEVLMGYNCTLFAYGQTGTGKTHTMAGDLVPTPMGNPSSNAGMIPRVLFRLFHYLETTIPDYSVKISYIELYNEELRDLLAVDFAAPTGHAQPMSKERSGGNNTSNTNNVELKIFEDQSKRGVLIQGLEEVPVKDSADALALLTRGSDRRQIAATKFNEHSSRSHSVFTITVHIKETSALGDDLLKIGKLNLVDLAGSENIGRSGAQNTRAREAGMINQSLLTLGRVINALVDKASHVPYRESKLTRLLQDSLGGRTKTCIVATISPARSNMEETLSTLDYALRAKSIRNKPELNQRILHSSLLKEHVHEIERLKADLLAVREKNGIYFSNEGWAEIVAKHELKNTEAEEWKNQVQVKDGQLRSVREEYDQSIGMLKMREGELKETRAKLRETEEVLEAQTSELNVVKVAFEEEVVVRQAFQETEVVLDTVAGGLKKVAAASIQDVGGLFDKLDRKTAVFTSNTKAVRMHGSVLSSDTTTLTERLTEYMRSSLKTTQKLRAEAQQLKASELEAYEAHSARINQQLERVGAALASIDAKAGIEHETLESIQNVLKETHQTFKSGFGAWGENIKKSCASSSTQVSSAGVNGFSTAEDALNTMASLIESIVRESKEYVEAERSATLEAQNLAKLAADKEVSRLRAQNQALVALLESEKVKAENANDQLMQGISRMLGEFAEERGRGLREAMGKVRSGNSEAERDMLSFKGKHGEVVKGMNARGSETYEDLGRRGGESKRTRDGALKTLTEAKSTFNAELNKMQTSVSDSIGTYSTQVQGQAQAMNTTCTEAFDRHHRAKRARLDVAKNMSTEVQSEYRHTQRSIASTSRNIETAVGGIVSETNQLENSLDRYRDATSSQLSSMHQVTQTLLDQGTKEDSPTGSTPRKRVWEYVEDWELTKNRETVLKEWRDRGISSVGSETFLAEHLPLPEDEHDDNDNTEMAMTPVSDSGSMDEAVYQPTESLASSSSSTASILSNLPVTHRATTGLRKKTVPLPTKASTTVDSRTTSMYTRLRRPR